MDSSYLQDRVNLRGCMLVLFELILIVTGNHRVNGQERTSSRITGPPRYACQNFKMAECDTRAA